MGKIKIDVLARIASPNKSTVTYCKRRRGLINKAIELSQLCDQRIVMVIYDKKKDRLATYQSHSDFNV